MDYLTTALELAERVPALDAHDPMIRAALDLAARPWLDGIHSGAEALAWGEFAVGVQTVADRLWPGPVALRVHAHTPAAGAALNHAAAGLAHAIADRFAQAAGDPLADDPWTLAAAAAELRAAVEALQ